MRLIRRLTQRGAIPYSYHLNVAKRDEALCYAHLAQGQCLIHMPRIIVCFLQAEEKTVDQACANSCREACRSSISEFTEARQKFSGFRSQPEEREKITRACTRRCVYECKKPADGYVFEVNTRR